MKKNRYILFALAFVVTAFIFDYSFLTPRSEELKESLETGYKALLKDEEFVRTSKTTAADMKAAIEETKKIEGRLIPEKSEFLAAAKLQGEISAMAGKSGLNIMTIRPLPSVKLGNYSVISLYFEGGGEIKQLSDFLKQIEEGKLLIKINKLNVNITNIQTPKDLKYKIQVSALAKP